MGTGLDIRVITDKWIPNHPSNMVIYPSQEVEWEWRVMELIDWIVGAWDRHFIETKFHKKDAEAILRIPLSRRYVADFLFWLFNRDDVYSVKSGYRVACKIIREVSMPGESSKAGAGESVWGKLWQLHIPNKIKVFGWRACHGILPTHDNLARKHVFEDSTCELCKRTGKSVLRALWECSVA